MAKFSGELVILPPLGPAEKSALAMFCDQNYKGKGKPSGWIPLQVTDKGLGWDKSSLASDGEDASSYIMTYVDLATTAKWLTDHVIPKFIAPLRHMSGKLIVEGEGVVIVNDNVVAWPPSDEKAPFGVKKDGTPKSKPGPKADSPKTLKEVLAEKKGLESAEPDVENLPYVEGLKEKIQTLEQQLVEAKKPKKSKVPAGKRWVRLTVSKEMDKDKFVEGVKMAVVGVEEIEVFE
jgi:hypothetical protein